MAAWLKGLICWSTCSQDSREPRGLIPQPSAILAFKAKSLPGTRSRPSYASLRTHSKAH